jgi:hypothetical protein
MNSDEGAAGESGKKQVPRRQHDHMTHEEAEGAVPEDLSVLGEEDGGVGIEHWWSDDDAEDETSDHDQ